MNSNSSFSTGRARAVVSRTKKFYVSLPKVGHEQKSKKKNDMANSRVVVFPFAKKQRRQKLLVDYFTHFSLFGVGPGFIYLHSFF